jgi:hypothetical protein
MRHEVKVAEVRDEFLGREPLGTVSSAKRAKVKLIGLPAMILLLLLLAAPAAMAETPRSINLDGLAPPAAMALVALAVEIPAEIPDQVARPDSPPVDTVHADPPDYPVALDRSELEPSILAPLLRLRSSTTRPPPTRSTDELIAAAVGLGTNPDLEPRNPFRKRRRDLFRAERPVSIGNMDMMVRLRLRAKARRAMSIEFRY